jgi:hypothetical protein
MTDSNFTTNQYYDPMVDDFWTTVGSFFTIQTVIYALMFIVSVEIAFILLYLFSVKDAKANKDGAIEERKGPVANPNSKEPSKGQVHKCNDPTCQHTKYKDSDMHVEEDENLVFDEQADVVFMQPGFNIKDHPNAAKAQSKKATAQQCA